VRRVVAAAVSGGRISPFRDGMPRLTLGITSK
jgi:hypothetical protein